MVKNTKKRRTKQGAPPNKAAGKPPKGQSGARGSGSQPGKIKGPRPSLFGMHAVREAWLNPARHVLALYLGEAAQDSFREILNEAQERGIKRPSPIITDKREIDRLCPDGAVHQGIALAAEPLPERNLQDLIIKNRDQDNALFLMLDQVTDPHNVGAILRSATAFGAAGVIMQRRHAPEMEGVLAKTACGAIEHIDVAYETNLSRAIEELKEAGYFVYGLDERGEQTIGAIKLGGKCALVLGAEGAGMRRLVKEHCDALLRLPTDGAPIASLNVSNAAAVALYAFAKNI